MRAAAIDRFGPPSVLRLRELPVPKPGPREVLIALDTAGVGSWDASIRDGSWRSPGRPRFPLVPGTDGAGIVVAKGTRVRRFRVGDRVYAFESGNRQGGFYAEFAVAKADHVGHVPGLATSTEACRRTWMFFELRLLNRAIQPENVVPAQDSLRPVEQLHTAASSALE